MALIVTMDDIGLWLARAGRLAATRAFGRGLVVAMPKLMAALSVIGTAAMLWVGGSIVIHGAEELGWGWLGHHIHDWAAAAGHALPTVAAFAEWSVKALLDGIFGVALGLALIPLAGRFIGPLWSRVAASLPRRG